MAERTVQMSPELMAELEASRERFVAKFGREPGPDDPLLWDEDADTPQPVDESKMTEQMVAAMKEAGIDGRLIYTFETTGLILSDDTYPTVDQDSRDAWNQAGEEWSRMSRQQKRAYLRK